MNRRSTPALFIPLAAMLAVAFPIALSFRQSSTPAGQGVGTSKRYATQSQVANESGADNKTKPPAKHDANKILSEFFEVKDYRTASWSASDFRSHYSVEFMIATVPDPIESRLPYLFDRFLGSIQRAAEAGHFVLDRYDLPWVEELQRIEAAKDNTGTDQKIAAAVAAAHPYDKEPGLVLFRDPTSGDHPRLLVLFVVGEIPTAGVNKEAFASALNQIAELRETHRTPENSSTQSGIRILGPTFSGSAESMDFALESWLSSRNESDKEGAAQIQIVSGSATAIPTNPELTRDHRHYFDLPKGLGTATFAATVVRDDVALQKFLQFLSDQQPVTQKRSINVGFLTEANTAYGNSLNLVLQGVQRTAKKEQVQFTCNRSPSARQPGQEKIIQIKACVVGLPFPLHISRLRSESEKIRQAREQSAQQVNPNTDSSRYLPVPYEDESENAQDAIPPFSALDTSSSELILANLLSTISHEQFDYVGIAATDVRDTIFLAGEIRQHASSSVMFSFNADLIYAHPEANPNTRGMLIVTPYPLFTLNQRWTDPSGLRGNRLQFPDQNSEGVYNAMLILLGKPTESGRLLEYGVPFPTGGTQSKAQLPPLWITTVGRGGFWPVAVLRSTDEDADTQEGPGSSPQENSRAGSENGRGQNAASLPQDNSGSDSEIARGLAPQTSAFVYFCWGLLCCVPAFLFLRRALLKRVSDTSFWAYDFGFAALPMFQDAAFARNRRECRAYFLAGGAAALAAYVVAVTAYALTSWKIPGQTHTSFFLIAMLAVIALSLGACLLLGKDTLSLLWHSSAGATNRWLAIPVLATSVVSLGLAGCLSAKWLSPGGNILPISGIITGFRVVNLSSGVSPLPPLFLIALASCAWAYSAVRRVRLAETLPWIHASECEGQSDSPVDTNKNSLFNSVRPSFKGFPPLESEVQELLRRPSLQLSGDLRLVTIATALSIVFAGIYLFYSRLVVALESSVFYLLFGVSFVLVYLSIAFNLLRLLFLWLALSKVLRAMERHPIRSAFARFHRSFPDLPRINLASAPSPLTALNFSIEQGTALARVGKALVRDNAYLVGAAAAAEEHITQAEEYFRKAVAAETSKERCHSLIAQLKAQRSLAEASCFIEDALELSWKTSPVSTETDAPLEESRQKLSQEAEEFLVGRTVLFLSHIFPQMTNLAGLSLASLLFLLLAVSSYPFQPHQLIVLFSWVIIFAFVGVALYMVVQMNRDTLLSNLNGSKPGELNWDREFITRIVLYVVIPVLGFLGVQFPDTVGQIFSFLSPGAAGHG